MICYNVVMTNTILPINQKPHSEHPTVAQESRFYRSVQKIQTIAKFLWNWMPFFVKGPLHFTWSVLTHLVRAPETLASLALSVYSYFLKLHPPQFERFHTTSETTNLGTKTDVPDNGNCLFYCMLLGLPKLPNGVNCPKTAQDFRLRVVDWMRDETNRDLIRGELEQTLRDYQAEQNARRAEECENGLLALALANVEDTMALVPVTTEPETNTPITIESYLDIMSQTTPSGGSSRFASTAEIAAICHMYGVQIHVFSQSEAYPLDAENYQQFGQPTAHTISIIHHNGNHFQFLQRPSC